MTSTHQILLLVRGDQASVALFEPQEHLRLGQRAAQAARLLSRVRPHSQVGMRVQFNATVWPLCSALAAVQSNLQGQLHTFSVRHELRKLMNTSMLLSGLN